MEYKILHLTLNKHWFDEIAKGIKTIEYREDKEYWVKRLKDKKSEYTRFKKFDFVKFKNGYNRGCPEMLIECEGIELKFPTVHSIFFDKFKAGKFFHIYLGEILDIENWSENAP